MSRDVQTSAGGGYDLGLHVVWWLKYRRPVLTGPVAARLRELLATRSARPRRPRRAR
ncbi:transposase [Pseudonocardia asaccharolytica]|uniref:Transposase IS200-like domain-containing protein n=1 Tax=Pseudonocardia asaccharolytica DSM 44247 = NBRC 16224 TaxID=1123024 RepID=A0A511D320_9PSEU|nr:transposase [Pseudonocardia asaccharolytica]GEL19181.1 hypothetical protein PA7_30180 [Pseudonocardia asaccharolytica DSM 44247 = NBRC 16224]